jgi:UDP-N-acetylglucosamine 1-carboxyvinyltransferase
LAAEGITEVTELHHVDRGYVDIVGKLRGLGAQISRVSLEEANPLKQKSFA